jgi:hypothetical protein
VRPKQLLRPKIFIKTILLFFSANALNLSLHELAHSITAWLLNVPSTLFHFYVDIDQNEATVSDQVIIAASGPVFSLLAGGSSWIFYKRSNTVTAKLFLFYAAIFGISTFFGNLFSTALAGDFSKVTLLLHFPKSLRYFISGLGILALSSFMFVAGRKFLNIGLSEEPQKTLTCINGLSIPWLLGTGSLILAYAPLPPHFVTDIVASSVFWSFSIIGAATGKLAAQTIHFSKVSVSMMDIVLFFMSLVIVRILALGIHFNP